MNKPMLRRVRIILIIAIITFIIFAGRLAYLQVVKHDYYWYRAEKTVIPRLPFQRPAAKYMTAKADCWYPTVPALWFRLWIWAKVMTPKR